MIVTLFSFYFNTDNTESIRLRSSDIISKKTKYIYICAYIAQVLSILLGCLVNRSVRHHSVVLERLDTFGSVLALE